MLTTEKMRNLFHQPTNGNVLARPLIRKIILALLMYIVTCAIVSADLLPGKISLDVGQVADRDVIAPHSASYVDVTKTNQAIEEAQQSVDIPYIQDTGAVGRTDRQLKTIFQEITATADGDNIPLEKKVEKFKQIRPNLPDELVGRLLSATEADRESIEQSSRVVLKTLLQRGVKEGDVEHITNALPLEIGTLELSPANAEIVTVLVQTLLKPNFFVNERELQRKREEAKNTVQPVYTDIIKGQTIVRKGEIVTQEHIQMLRELKLQKQVVNVQAMVGYSLFVLLTLAVIVIYLVRFSRVLLENDKQMLLLAIIIIISLLLAKAAHYYSDFLAPVSAGTLLVAILLDRKLGIVTAVVLSVFVGVMSGNNLTIMLAVMGGSIASVYSISRFSQGHTLTRSGIVVAITNFIFIITMGMIFPTPGVTIMKQGLMGIINGLVSVVITIGMLPFLEACFKITSHVSLLDLAKPNNPLLQRLLMEAPGTYHHSMVVANLGEAAADAIGADPVVVRVGAYFHDIGKIKRPYFFIENQMGNDNPHEKIAPSLSTKIVLSHIKDGLELAREYKLPGIIQNVIAQHHGTTLVSYFYRMASENEHSDCMVEQDFRYDGPPPQSKESAIVMLADATEAAVRSLSRTTVNRMEGTVRKIIKEKLHDGQFDECNLTLRELNTIGDVFIRILSGMFHSRIEYPDNITKK